MLLNVKLPLNCPRLLAPLHAFRVSRLAAEVARQLGLPPASVQEVHLAGWLHDCGKLLLPLRVLNKVGPLSAAEWQLIRRHPVYSARLARLLPGVSARVRTAIRHHHERLDGAGYPAGLAGEAIPLLSRILAVCDAYDALVSERAYKRAWSREAALQELGAQSGRQFDPQVVAVLAGVVEQCVPSAPGPSTPLRSRAHLHGQE